MAYPKYQGYQYETSPRKLQPEYEPKKNPYKQKKSSTKSMKTEKNAPKKKMKPKVKLVLYIFAAFAVLFAMGYQNSLITESCNKKEKLKKEVNIFSSFYFFGKMSRSRNSGDIFVLLFHNHRLIAYNLLVLHKLSKLRSNRPHIQFSQY